MLIYAGRHDMMLTLLETLMDTEIAANRRRSIKEYHTGNLFVRLEPS